MTTTFLKPSKLLPKRLLRTCLLIENLSFWHNNTPILEKVNLALPQGVFAVLFGPNGGGKTTLFKLILGLLKPSSGSLSLYERSKIGYVPQKPPFDPLFPISTEEVVMQGALSQTTWWGHLPKEWKEKARSLLKQVGLASSAKRRFGTLSGGEMQRVLIARALLSEPSLLLLDEPTAHIDTKAEKEILDLLLQLKGKATILLITHNLQPLLAHATSLYCLNHTLTPFLPEELCNHFSIGLYPPEKE